MHISSNFGIFEINYISVYLGLQQDLDESAVQKTGTQEIIGIYILTLWVEILSEECFQAEQASTGQSLNTLIKVHEKKNDNMLWEYYTCPQP